MIPVLIIIIVSTCLLAGGYFYYRHWLKPNRIIQWYTSTFQGLGYNVITLPYQPFKITLADIRKYSQKEHGDACYEEKHSWPSHDIVITNTASIVTLIFLKPRLIKSLFSPQKQQVLTKSLLNKAGFSMTLRNSLILNESEYWKRKRKIFTDILNFEFIKSKVPKMIKIAQKIADRMQKQGKNIVIDPQSKSFEVQLLPYFESMIAEIVVGIFFGTEDIEMNIDEIPINRYITQVLADSRQQSSDWAVLLLGQKAYQWGVAPKYRKLNNRINKLRSSVKQMLETKIEQTFQKKLTSYSNLFEALIYLKQQRNQEKDLLDSEEFISQFCAFMSASNDSTANFLNGLFYYLMRNQQVLTMLQKKIKAAIKKPEDLNFSNIRSIEYLEWCQNETLRMYGPATSILLRETTADTYIDNLPVMSGTGIKIQMLASHYNPNIYKDPFKFDPLRWQDQDPDPYKLGGFGLGPHACLGKSLALLASKIITTVLLFRYQKIQTSSDRQIDFVFQGMYKPEPFSTIFVRDRAKEIEETKQKAIEARKQLSKLCL